MAGCFGSHPEDRAMSGELNAYLRREEEAEAEQDMLEEQIAEFKHEALTNETVFDDLNEGYEFIESSQLMRILREYPRAINGDQIAKDAILTAINNICQGFDTAARHKCK